METDKTTRKQFVWVFNGQGGRFASGLFFEKSEAAAWISKYKLTGVLTRYPVGVSVYDWAIENKSFVPKREDQHSPEFVGKFSSASLEHYHFEDGESC